MNQDDKDVIQVRLTAIFRQVFDDDSIELFDEMTADDIDEWDSLTHITLIVAAEKEFEVRFNAAEIQRLKNVGGMIALLIERTAT